MSDTLTFNGLAKLRPTTDVRHERIQQLEAELATLRTENAHLKRALALSDALRNKERNLPL